MPPRSRKPSRCGPSSPSPPSSSATVRGSRALTPVRKRRKRARIGGPRMDVSVVVPSEQEKKVGGKGGNRGVDKRRKVEREKEEQDKLICSYGCHGGRPYASLQGYIVHRRSSACAGNAVDETGEGAEEQRVGECGSLDDSGSTNVCEFGCNSGRPYSSTNGYRKHRNSAACPGPRLPRTRRSKSSTTAVEAVESEGEAEAGGDTHSEGEEEDEGGKAGGDTSSGVEEEGEQEREEEVDPAATTKLDGEADAQVGTVASVLEALHLASIPREITCRQTEHEQLRGFLDVHLSSRTGGSIYLAGSPGTGKTLSVDTVLRRLRCSKGRRGKGTSPNHQKENEVRNGKHTRSSLSKLGKEGKRRGSNNGKKAPVRSKRMRIVKINAMALSTPQGLYPKLLEQLTGNKAHLAVEPLAAADWVQQLLVPPREVPDQAMTVVVVDEIDRLVSKAQMVLYRLFEWPKKQFSTLILIGIANAIELTERFLPHLRVRHCQPQVLVFKPYSQQELLSIITQRVREGGGASLFEQEALELCSRKVAASSGDVRKCLDLCRQALQEGRRWVQGSDSVLVDVDMMAVVVRSAVGSRHVGVVQSMPQHQQILLCVAAIAARLSGKEASMKRFQSLYRHLSTLMVLPSVVMAEFHDISEALSTNGLLTLYKARRGDRRLAVNVPWDDLEFALGDKPFFQNLLKRGEGLRMSAKLSFMAS